MSNSNIPNKTWAFIGMFLPVLGFVFVLLFNSQNSYAMYYAKQGLLLGLVAFMFKLISVVPFLGQIVSWIGMILLLILWILGLVYTVSGEEKGLPIIGELAEQF